MRAARSRWSVLAGASLALAGLVPAGGSAVAAGVQPSGVVAPLPASSDPVSDIQAYITQVYRDLFDRAPDPVGLAAWTDALFSGVPYGSVANAITGSTEYRSGLITAAYLDYLGRPPEPAGLQAWLGQMAIGSHIEQVQAGFIASDEFYARSGGADPGWVTLLYRTVLDRDPASSEVHSWVAAMAGGTSRSSVALGFLYSTEHLTTVVDGYYLDLLDRHIDPSGQTTWVGLIQTGHRDEEIIAGIVSSTEYRSKVSVTAPAVHLDTGGGPQTCVDGALVGGSIAWELPLPTGVQSVRLFRGTTFVSDGPAEGLAPGTYTLRVQVADGYALVDTGATDKGSGLYHLARDVPAYGGVCAPAPTPVHLEIGGRPQTCVDSALVGGSIGWEVPLATGIESVHLYLGDAFVTDGPAEDLEPGTYTVRVQVADGYVMEDPAAADHGHGLYYVDWDIPIHQGAFCPPSRVSVGSDGTEADESSEFPSISADGRWVAYASSASNLVAGDTNHTSDVFLTDRTTGETSLVSVGLDGAVGNSSSYAASISADGRWVAFGSQASNLVTEDDAAGGDVFVWDRVTGVTSLVSAGSDVAADAASGQPAISADGRWIAYMSSASNLVDGDTNGHGDLFVWDQVMAVTSLVPIGTGGLPPDSVPGNPSISADGRWIAFEAIVPDLQGWSVPDVFVTDRTTGDTTLVSAGLDGPHLTDGAYEPSISADGRWIAYSSQARNLAEQDTNAYLDVFAWDRITGKASVVSIRADGGSANGHSADPSISADGRWVAYTSVATNLADGSRNGAADVLVTDRMTGVTSLVSGGMGGIPANNTSARVSISADGHQIAFASDASNLVTGDTNGRRDVFVVDRITR